MKKIIFFFFVLFNVTKLDAQSLTVREVYGLHVGDELGIYHDRTGSNEFRFMKVIKRMEIGTDSLQLTYYVRTMQPRMQGSIYGEDTITVHIGNLDSPFFKNYVKHHSVFKKYHYDSLKKYWEYTSESWDSTYEDDCGLIVNWRYYSFNSEAYYEENETLVYKGLGVLKRWYMDEGGPYSERRDQEYLRYYIKDGILCGNKKAFPLSLTQVESTTQGMIYPNPANGVIFISGIPEFSFSLRNLQGQELMHGKGMENNPILVEDLPSGVYFIMINNGNSIITYKLLLE